MAEYKRHPLNPEQLLDRPEVNIPNTVKFFQLEAIDLDGQAYPLQEIIVDKTTTLLKVNPGEKLLMVCLSVPFNLTSAPSLVSMYDKIYEGTIFQSKPMPQFLGMTLNRFSPRVLARYQSKSV